MQYLHDVFQRTGIVKTNTESSLTRIIKHKDPKTSLYEIDAFYIVTHFSNI